MFLATYLIGLREGLEMVLVVSVLVAYLVKTGRRRYLVPVWLGVGAAVVLSLGFGWLLDSVSNTFLGSAKQELFDAIVSLVAVALVTWMIFWMRSTARKLSGELRGRLDDAIGLGGGAVVGIAFLAIVREGLETTLLFFAYAEGADTSVPALGLGAGVLTAMVLGVALYLGAIRINLSRFFLVSGLLLIFIAAGIFKYAVHDFQEAAVLPGLSTIAFDASGWLVPGTWYAELLAGLINFTPQPSVLEFVAWLAYLIPVLIAFVWPAPLRLVRAVTGSGRSTAPATVPPATVPPASATSQASSALPPSPSGIPPVNPPSTHTPSNPSENPEHVRS